MLALRYRWFAAIIALALSVHTNGHAQEPSAPAADAQRFTDATTKLIAAINADDQAALQQMFNETMQQALPAEKTGPFFRELLSAKGKLESAGAPEVSGPAAKVRVTAERGAWQFEITLDPSTKIAGLLVQPVEDRPRGNEEPPPVQPASDGTPKTEASYLDLRKSKDRLTRQYAERYYNLVKLQEWSSDKGTKIMAKYVSHDADRKTVTLATAKGSGAARVVKEMSVPVARLSKTSQSRVKQIATIQAKLDELAAKADAPETVVGETGAPMTDERGVQPVRTRTPRRLVERTESPEREAAPVETPSAIESTPTEDGGADPLGFGELPNETPIVPNVPGPRPSPQVGALQADPGRAPRKPPGRVDPASWRTDYEAFRANFRTDPASGLWLGDWGALKELQAAVDEVKQEEADGDVGTAELQVRQKKFDAVGEFSWEATLADADSSSGDWTERLNMPPLPDPLSIGFFLDEENPGNWQGLKTGDRVRFSGRFVDFVDGDLEAAIRFPNEAAASEATRPEESRDERR